MNELLFTINFTTQKFIIEGINLISGDYNSTKIKFKFEDNKEGTKIIEIRPLDSETKNPTFMSEIINNEVILVSRDEENHSITPFPTGGTYLIEVSLYNGNSKLSTITKHINILEEQIIVSDEIVTPYLSIFDELIQEIITATTHAENVNIDVTKTGDITTVTITNKEGIVKSVQIKDGVDGINGIGISSINKISTVGLVDTYRIKLTDDTFYDYTVTNGNGIDRIEKTGTVDNIDTYTIYYTNGTTTSYTVTNSTVTNQEFEELQDRVEYLGKYNNALIKNTNTGTELTINDTVECPMGMSLAPSDLKQAILPDTYQQVDYIESDGTQYLNVGKILSSTFKFEVEYIGTRKFGPSSSRYSKALFGCRGSSIADRYVAFSNGQNNDFLGIGNGSLQLTKNTSTSVTKLIYDNTSVSIQSSTYSYTNDTLNVSVSDLLDIYVFARNDNGSVADNGSYKVYSFKMYDNNVLIRNLLPCYRISDNEVGMYDLVNDVFYTNAGTGTFTKGNNAPTPDSPVTIHTISGDNTITVSNSDNTQSQTLPLNLGDLEYCKIDDYADEFYKATESDTGLTAGKWYLKKYIRKRTIGSLTGKDYNSTYNYFYGIASDMYREGFANVLFKGYSKIYQRTTSKSNADWDSKPDYVIGTRQTTYAICFKDSNYTNKTDFFNARNNEEIYYVLATPTYTLLNDTLQTQLNNIYNWVLSYQNQTNISQTNTDLPFVITATTCYDLNKLLIRVETLESEV